MLYVLFLFTSNKHSVVFPIDGTGLAPEEVTIAEVLRDAGYKTGA